MNNIMKEGGTVRKNNWCWIVCAMILLTMYAMFAPASVRKAEENAAASMLDFDSTIEFISEEDGYVWNLNVGFYEDESGEMELYLENKEDPMFADEYVYGFFIADKTKSDTYHIFTDKEHKTYFGSMEIFEEDGMVIHCDLYRENYPIQSFLDIHTIYGVVE